MNDEYNWQYNDQIACILKDVSATIWLHLVPYINQTSLNGFM